MADSKERLEQAASEPRTVEGDYGRVSNHSLTDQIELDRYLAQKDASPGKKVKRLYAGRFQPPSARGS